MKSQSFNINNVYLDSIGVIVSKKEKEGPLGRYFPSYIDDYYINCDSFEKAQVKLSKMAIKKLLINQYMILMILSYVLPEIYQIKYFLQLVV